MYQRSLLSCRFPSSFFVSLAPLLFLSFLFFSFFPFSSSSLSMKPRLSSFSQSLKRKASSPRFLSSGIKYQYRYGGNREQIISSSLSSPEKTTAFISSCSSQLYESRAFTSSVLRQGKGKGKEKQLSPEELKYKDSVNLPSTTFDQRANAVVKEPQLQAFWEEHKIYEKLYQENSGSKFILHDGPPYANGDLHIGHALNKILKDFINRYKTLQGHKVKFIPGWDTHGLPIELKVLQTLKGEEKKNLTPLDLREKAASFAAETVDKQRDSFKRYGVWADWDTPYVTMDHEYEAAQLGVFGKMWEKGIIYRGKKPVNWSPSSRTALAEAELEYPEGHVSRSAYVAFHVSTIPGESKLKKYESTGGLAVCIWTTTPWTLPANLAVSVAKHIEYSIVRHPKLNDGRLAIVAKDLVDKFAEKTLTVDSSDGNEKKEVPQLEIVETMTGADLIGLEYQHPLYKDRQHKVIEGGDYITTESGTALVHTAPGHGQEDYITGLKNNLPLLSPVDDAGRFTKEAGEDFVGKNVLTDGNQYVLDLLNESGHLLAEEKYNHKYPYDWRTKKPTIFRATAQWFASVASFREDALNAIKEVEWLPEIGQRRITTMTESRSDWCISRQRSWGVPIPAFYDKESGEVLLNNETLTHIQNIVRKEGTNAWFSWDVVDLLPESHKHLASTLIKGTDTMDVWFDSGSSWAGVLETREGLETPADIYLEGSDQHRGWFQSSLLTSVAANGKAPYKQVITHGFVLDEKGLKMSKSLGNVVDPKLVIEGGNNKKTQPAYGADVLRLWASSVDYSGDVSVGDSIIKQVSDSYRKLRNTARYLLGNLYDFNPTTNTVAYKDLAEIDKWILGKLTETITEVTDAMDNFQFFKASQALMRFASSDLSNFYLDVAKDRLYISGPDDYRRRSCQTVLHILAENLATLMAPLLPHMAEDIWQAIPYSTGQTSVFQRKWGSTEEYPSYESEKFNNLLNLRTDINKAIEKARIDKTIGASLEAEVLVYLPELTGERNSEKVASLDGVRDVLKAFHEKYVDTKLLSVQNKDNVDNLSFLLLVSKVRVISTYQELKDECKENIIEGDDSGSGAIVGIKKVGGSKCVRCWFYWDAEAEEYVETQEEGDHEDDGACPRCQMAAKEVFAQLSSQAADSDSVKA